MTKTVLTTFLVLIFLTACGQQKIENKLTKEHQSVKGTKVSLIPPKGFKEVDGLSGFFDLEQNSNVQVLILPMSYSETIAEYNKDTLLAFGFKISKEEKLTINGLPAIFITGVGIRDPKKTYVNFMLILSTYSDTETIVMNGLCPESLKGMSDEIKKSMLSVYYDIDKKLNPFDVVDYTIDVSATKLQFGMSSNANIVMFTVDGKFPTDSDDKTSLMITKTAYLSETETSDALLRLEALETLRKAAENIEYEHINEIVIDGLSGYEIYSKGKNKYSNSDETEYFYQVMLFGDGFRYLFLGITNDTTNKSLETLKKVVMTFKRK